MLLQIREYFRRQKVASTQQVARELDVEPSALQPMLEWWIKKGVLAPCETNSTCKTQCFKCKTPPMYYQYINKD